MENLEQVKQYFQNNAESQEVKEYLQGFKTLSVEEVQNLVKTDKSLSSWFDSEKDKHSSKALDTYRQGTVPKLVQEELAKLNPNKDEKDLKLEKFEAELKQWKTKTIRESVKNEALKFASDNKLPSDVIDFFIALDNEDNEEGTKSREATMANLSKLKNVWGQHLESSVKDKLKSNGFTPKDIEPNNNIQNLENMSMEEYKKSRSNN